MSELFKGEDSIFDNYTKILKKSGIEPEDLYSHCSTLLREYEKLLKQFKKITKLGDSYQKKLMLARNKMEEQNKELQEAYKKIEFAARQDPLTGLWNRRAIHEFLNEEIKRFNRSEEIFSLILCDIDHFKNFNDTYGHDCGDFVLKSLSCLISSSIRNTDKLCRWGGEEFLILLVNTNTDSAKKIAEHIRERIEHKIFEFNDIKLETRMTFGVSTYKRNINIEECIKHADLALYNGKSAGRNCVVIYEENMSD